MGGGGGGVTSCTFILTKVPDCENISPVGF